MAPDNRHLLKEIWDVKSNRYCGECRKPLVIKPFDRKEEIHVLLEPDVILLCDDCKNIHLNIASKKFEEAQKCSNDVQQRFPSNSKLK